MTSFRSHLLPSDYDPDSMVHHGQLKNAHGFDSRAWHATAADVIFSI